MHPTHLLFPSSYFSLHKTDEDLQPEYEAALETGLWETVRFSYEQWFEGGRIVLEEAPAGPVCAVYRGWMMQPERYAEFYRQLGEQNVRLVTSPEDYARFHIFPNIYPSLQEDTARMLVFPEGTPVDLTLVKRSFDRFMVKDFVKSVKGTQFPAFFDKSITQEDFDRHMQDFYRLRGSLYTGGLCIKEYLDLRRYDGHVNEYRVFYMNREIASICRNSGQPAYTPEPPQALLEKYRTLKSPFFTIDYAELADGTWKALEAGDGQVSGLSDHQDAAAFYRRLYHAFG